MKLKKNKLLIMLAETGKTNAEFAKMCGISPQQLSAIKTRGTCRPESIVKIAHALETDPEKLIECED